MARKHVPMAIAYDFDGTLAPGSMQEHQFLPDIGIKAKEFWKEVKSLTKEQQADEVSGLYELDATQGCGRQRSGKKGRL